LLRGGDYVRRAARARARCRRGARACLPRAGTRWLRRGRQETGEYAKASPEDIFVLITIANRGPETATLHVLPTLWFRNTWSWGDEAPKLGLRRLEGQRGISVVVASHAEMGER